jgi:hypothetical protein
LREQLKSLRELQEEDRKLHELQRTRDAIPAKIAEMRVNLEAIQGILEKERAQLGEVERFRREQDREMKAQSESLQASKNKAARNTKEFNALQREVDAQKKSQQDREEELAKLSTAIEESSRSISAHEAEYKKLFDEVTEQENAGREKVAKLDQELQTIRQNRAVLAKKMPSSILARYDQILKRRKDGVAVVGARNGACLGCHMNLPPQLFNTVIKGQTFEMCPSCHRILYYDPPEVAPAAPK